MIITMRNLLEILSVTLIILVYSTYTAQGSHFKINNDGGNLLQNSGLEKSVNNKLAGWKTTRFGGKGGKLTVINDNLVAHSGNMCAKLEATGSRIGIMQSTKIWPGKKYVFKIYARAENKSQLEVDLYFYKMVNFHLKGLGKNRKLTFDVTDKWQECMVEFIVPEGTFSMIVCAQTKNKPLYIDDASLMAFHPATIRFLPSLEKLVVNINAGIKTGKTKSKVDKTEINVYKKSDKIEKKPVISHTVTDFKDDKAVWRCSTKELPEGNYTVEILLKDNQGKILAQDDDWFKKKIFPWMKDKPWESGKVPAPYTQLKTEGNKIMPWGRTYTFNDSGLLKSVVSQNKELLAAPMSFIINVDGKKIETKCEKPFTITDQKSGKVSGKSELRAGNLVMSLDITTEYDGLTLYKLTYKPLKDSVKVNRLRLNVPLKAEHAFLFSAGTDSGGKTILADVFPEKQGKLYDSVSDTSCAGCSPNFCTLFWVGGYHTCFCYAADSDVGWILHDNAPAVEVIREGDRIILWLNLVDRKYELKESRTLEFAFQAGPIKALPENWRGIQFGGNPDDALQTVFLGKYCGSGVTCGGGANFIYPGATKEIKDRFIKLRQEEIAGGNKAVTGYHYYATAPKGLEETKVFRSEWGIDKDTWDSVKESQVDDKNWEWRNQFFGKEKSRYQIMKITPSPSYVDCATYGYNEVLKYLPISGHYDDVGYPKQAYDEELGLGGRDVQGRKIYSSGLWTYRKRWKQEAYVNWLNKKPNFLMDSQHVRAHYMPAYGFIGLWAPCEHGYYNRYADKDILEFYGSLNHYLAYNPAHQFGQIPMIGLSTKKWEETGTDKDMRCIMMITMLHDHDVGSFGKRNLRTVCRLRAARNIFKQWEKDVKFIGYWENSKVLKTSSNDVKVSIYARPGSALFIIGNVGNTDVKTDVKVKWDTLGINPDNLKIINPETLPQIPPSENGFSLDVPKHDIRLVLAGDLKDYTLPEKVDWNNLPKPKEILKQYSDNLKGPELSTQWEKVLHKGKSSVGFLYDKLYLQGAHYGYAMIREKLHDQDNISIQCVIARQHGGHDPSAGSLFLFWKNGSYLQAGIAYKKKQFLFNANGKRIYGSKINAKSPYGWYPCLENAVKIKLTPEDIEFYGSSDGKTWSKTVPLKRGDKFKGAPEYLAIGNGHKGKKPYMENVYAKHFNNKYPSTTFFSNLIIGKD